MAIRRMSSAQGGRRFRDRFLARCMRLPLFVGEECRRHEVRDVRPRRTNRANRHDTTIDRQGQFDFATLPSCKASTRAATLSTLKKVSISSGSDTIRSVRPGRPGSVRRGWSSAIATDRFDAGGASILAIRQVTDRRPPRPSTRLMGRVKICWRTVRAVCPCREGSVNSIPPSGVRQERLPTAFRRREGAIMLRPDQPVGGASQDVKARCISSAISASRSAIMARVECPVHGRRHFGDPLVPLSPAQASRFPRLPSVASDSRAHIHASVTPSGSRSGVTHSRMKIHLRCCFVGKRPQPESMPMAAEVQLGAVLQAEHDAGAAHPGFRLGDVRIEDGLLTQRSALPALA